MEQNSHITHETGSVRVKNLSACWLLQIALKRETGGTVYRVTGSYEEEGLLNGKLRRTLAQHMERASRHP